MKASADILERCLEAVARANVVVVGDLMLDRYVWGDASRLSPEAPVPVVKVDRVTAVAGGAANVALNLRSLGATVSLFGSLGDDESGATLRSLLDAADVRFLPGAVAPGRRTIVKTRVLCRRQQVCRLDVEDAPALHAHAPDAFRAAIAAAGTPSALLLSDYAKGVLSTESVALLQSLVPEGTLVAMDPKPRKGIAYAGLGLMTPNRSEALALAGLDESPDGTFPAEEVCRRIHERHRPRRLDVTLGADGMLLAEEGRMLDRIPTVAREVFDVSGAGDTVIAALTAALSGGIPFAEAARFANLAAGVVVGKLGTATATPDELRRALRSADGAL